MKIPQTYNKLLNLIVVRLLKQLSLYINFISNSNKMRLIHQLPYLLDEFYSPRSNHWPVSDETADRIQWQRWTNNQPNPQETSSRSCTRPRPLWRTRSRRRTRAGARRRRRRRGASASRPPRAPRCPRSPPRAPSPPRTRCTMRNSTTGQHTLLAREGISKAKWVIFHQRCAML